MCVQPSCSVSNELSWAALQALAPTASSELAPPRQVWHLCRCRGVQGTLSEKVSGLLGRVEVTNVPVPDRIEPLSAQWVVRHTRFDLVAARELYQRLTYQLAVPCTDGA